MRKAFFCLLFLCVLAVAVMRVGGSSPASAPASPFVIQAQGMSPKHHLLRISQLDPAQYSSSQEYTPWAYSTCSTAALVEVFNFYGRHYRIHDVLAVESASGAITPELGLTEDGGIARTASQFGFQTEWGYRLSLDQVIETANRGIPIIVGFPPARYPSGHLLVVTGGTATMVFVADSSRYDRTSITRQRFLQWWAGYSAIVRPKGGK